MAINSEFKIKSDSDQIELLNNLPSGTNSNEKPLSDFYFGLSKLNYFNSGLLPCYGTGILSIRKAFGDMQVVFQHEPQIYQIAWSSYEGGTPVVYQLAQPWRIVVLDFVDNNLLGGKQFYSTSAITHLDQILYHTNVPNTNCRGYGPNNAVGWTCIYLNKDTSNFGFDELLRYGLKRISGEETYNDGNMSETDGTRFYQEFSPHKFLSSAEAWQEKTKTQGYDWTLDPSLWLPIKVKNPDQQDRHDENGPNLSLRWAMYGHYSAYYSDTAQGKPNSGYSAKVADDKTDWARRKWFNIIDRAEADAKAIGNEIFLSSKKAFSSSSKIIPIDFNTESSGAFNFGSAELIKKVINKSCPTCHVSYQSEEATPDLFYPQGHWTGSPNIKFVPYNKTEICSNCHSSIKSCASCDTELIKSDQVNASKMIPKNLYDNKIKTNDVLCSSCYKKTTQLFTTCQKCSNQYVSTPSLNNAPAGISNLYAKLTDGLEQKTAEEYLNMFNGYVVCTECTPLADCELCNTTTDNWTTAFVGDEEVTLCSPCFSEHKACACNKLVSSLFVVETQDGKNICEGCVGYLPDGSIQHDPEHKLSEVIIDMDDIQFTQSTEETILVMD